MKSAEARCLIYAVNLQYFDVKLCISGENSDSYTWYMSSVYTYYLIYDFYDVIFYFERINAIRQFIFDWHMLRHQLLNNNNKD